MDTVSREQRREMAMPFWPGLEMSPTAKEMTLCLVRLNSRITSVTSRFNV